VHTASQMAAEIERLLADPAARVEMERHARATVERDYSWDTIAARQAELYRELAGLKDPRAIPG